ncbi:MAG: hypothetical protein ABSB97_00760 [Thermoplasmata archaeon]|jgi:hypothetical protein
MRGSESVVSVTAPETTTRRATNFPGRLLRVGGAIPGLLFLEKALGIEGPRPSSKH